MTTHRIPFVILGRIGLRTFPLLGIWIARFAIALAAISERGVADVCVPRQEGLIAWWAFDGDFREFIARQDGTGNSGAEFSIGKVGGAVKLDGDEGFVEASVPISSMVKQKFSIDAWIWLDRLKDACIASQYDTYNREASWGLIARPDGILDFGLFGGSNSGPARYRQTAPGTLVPGRWFHVAATVDLESQSIHLYVNGHRVPSDIGYGYNDEFIQFYPSTTPVRIGSIRNVGGSIESHFPGMIDEVALYNRVLEETEIARIFNAGSGGRCRIPPTVELEPIEGEPTVVSCIPKRLNLSAKVQEGDERVVRIEYYDDTRPVGNSLNPRSNWITRSEPLNHGSHRITVHAIDAFGLRATSRVEVLSVVWPSHLQMNADRIENGKIACCMGTEIGSTYLIERVSQIESPIWSTFLSVKAEGNHVIFTNQVDGDSAYFRGRKTSQQ